jgi:hypothetical protein
LTNGRHIVLLEQLALNPFQVIKRDDIFVSDKGKAELYDAYRAIFQVTVASTGSISPRAEALF